MSQNLNEDYKSFIDHIGRKMFVTVIFSVIFLIGLAYIDSYLSYFGINHLITDLPIFCFLIQAILPIIFVLFLIIFIIYITVVFDKLLKKRSGKLKPKYSMIRYLIFYVTFYYFATEYIFPPVYPPYAKNFINSIFLGVLISTFIWMYWSEKIIKIINNFLNKNNMSINQIYTIFLVVILVLLIATGSLKGKIDARNVVEGSNVRFIDFEWKEITPEGIDGKELVLITYREGNYYVVIHQTPAPEFPKVFIIPDDKINFAIIRRIN